MEKVDILNALNKFKTKGEAYKYFNLSGNAMSILKLKEIANSVNFDLNIYAERRKGDKKYCLKCGKELNSKQVKFCSRSCSAKVCNIGRVQTVDTIEKIRYTLKNKSNKKLKIKLCKICGQEKCLNLDVCKHPKNWFNNLIFFGFDNNILGTINIHKEYYRIKELLEKEYLDNNLSPSDISKKYLYDKNSENILHILKAFKIKTRNLSESEINAYLSGKILSVNGVDSNYQFKHGWHKTWNNKKVYYRSSYELKYIKILDENKIDYETEYFRIKYWDSEKCKYRVAIPDIFIKMENKIIEIKSKVTFNKQNIIDKFKEYKKLGFDVYMIHEHTEYSYDEMLELNENHFLIGSMK